MNDDAAIAWLRGQIEGDLSAARIISDGGIAPQRWTTDPPGQVNPEHHPASAAITALLGDDHAHWTSVIAWDHEIGEDDDEDGRVSYLPSMLVSNGRREVDHVCRHDPRDVVADSEAKLAILDADQTQLWTLTILARAYRHRDGYGEHWES